MKTESDFPRRPKRLERLFSSMRSFYFVTFNTRERRAILARPEIHEAFRSFCDVASARGISVGRYVIMPDHVHLFVSMDGQDMKLSAWVKLLKTALVKSLKGLGIDGPHWQESFFDHVMRSSESYSQKWDYVRMNPVRAGLCKEPDDWPFQGEVVTLRF